MSIDETINSLGQLYGAFGIFFMQMGFAYVPLTCRSR